ncbi:MAG: DUF3854 domain-containing protein [Actinomycetota bacterium]|nr:DUF3854 domain-containing protein [Actinomycetota bacterium]
MLYDESGISPVVAAERGYQTVRSCAELPAEFKGYQRRRGLLVPMHSPDGETVGYQLRSDKPRKGGPKYETPGGISPVVDVHPRMLKEVRSGDGPLLITEGAKTGDAATSRGIHTVVLAGVWMWCVPKAKPYRLKPCFDHFRLEGREVFVAFDSDCMSKGSVQDALAALVAALQDRGAVVKVIYLPNAPDGSKQGVDDYLVAGGTIREMFMLAREFEPADIGEIRLSRDDKLRAAVGYLWRRWREDNWMEFVGAGDKGNWQRGHTARDAMEALIGLAGRNGKLDSSGLVVEVGLRRLSRLAAKTAPSVGAAMKHLEADGQIEILPATDKAKPRRYRLLVPSAALYSMEGGIAGDGSSEESEPRCKGLRYPSAPRLRYSSPARLGRLVRRVEGATGRTVTEAVGENIFVPPDYRPYAKRLGPHRCAVLDALEAAGGEMHLKDLCEALHRKRPWDVRRRILKPLEKAGIIECEGDVIRLATEWLTSLDARREEDGEIEQAEKQVKKHRTDGERYRMHLERKKHGTPKASDEAVRRAQDLRERRLREIREEEERDRAPTPSAVEALVLRILGQHDRVRMGLLCGIAMDEGLRWRDVPPAVRRMGYHVERLPEYDNAEFVFAKQEAA